MSFHKNVSRKENSIEIFNFGGACVSTVDDLSNHIQMTLGFFFLSGKYTQSEVESLAFHNPRLNFSKYHLYVCTVYGLLTWKTLSLGCRPIGVSWMRIWKNGGANFCTIITTAIFLFILFVIARCAVCAVHPKHEEVLHGKVRYIDICVWEMMGHFCFVYRRYCSGALCCHWCSVILCIFSIILCLRLRLWLLLLILRLLNRYGFCFVFHTGK